MRNFNEHPITQEEEVATLRELADSLEAEARMGDSRPTILRSAADRIEKSV